MKYLIEEWEIWKDKIVELIDAGKLNSEEDYRKAISELEIVFDADPDTAEGVYAKVLSTFINIYEDEFYPIDPPDQQHRKINKIIAHLCQQLSK